MTPYQMMEAIDDAENKVGETRAKYLRKSGWEYTCQTPGSYWMWTKEIDGKHFFMDMRDADRTQRDLDYREMNKPHAAVLDNGGDFCIICGAMEGEPEASHTGDKHEG